jgi:hypothetical protein
MQLLLLERVVLDSMEAIKASISLALAATSSSKDAIASFSESVASLRSAVISSFLPTRL